MGEGDIKLCLQDVVLKASSPYLMLGGWFVPHKLLDLQNVTIPHFGGTLQDTCGEQSFYVNRVKPQHLEVQHELA